MGVHVAAGVVPLAGCKFATWRQSRLLHSTTRRRTLAYLLAWPGMDAETFLDPRRRPTKPLPRANGSDRQCDRSSARS
jgi:hypothetical protein